MQNLENVKIVKNCRKEEKLENEVKVESCKEFEFDQENFLNSVEKEILFIDDSIKFENPVRNSKTVSDKPEITDTTSRTTRKSPPICFCNIPKKLNEQISLPIENIKDLSFYETFIISQKEDETDEQDIDDMTNTIKANEIGSACLMVEELTNGNILVFTIQQIFINGERTTYESLSVVTKDLKLVREKRIERKCSDSMFMEKAIFIETTDDGYQLSKTLTNNEDTEHWKSDLVWTKSEDFLSWGAQVLMIRKLVTENFNGCIQSYTCDINGDFTLSQYWFHKIKMEFIYDHAMTIKRVDHMRVYDDMQIDKYSSFFLLQSGQMLKQIDSNQSYFIHMNPFVDPFEKKCTENLQENWHEDVQLMSMYLEYKAKRKQELKQKFESPQMKFLLNEYIQNLIKSKPNNIMNFTVEFIRKLEHNNNVNVQLQIFKTIERRTQQN